MLFLLAYLDDVLTIISPCILPVLPFVVAPADRPFAHSGLPMLVCMAVTFAAVATLAAVAGGWAVEANELGRALAMALLALFGLVLLFPNVSARLMPRSWTWDPGCRAQVRRVGVGAGASVASSLLLGACQAGPIRERTFEVRFHDPGVHAYALTFG